MTLFKKPITTIPHIVCTLFLTTASVFASSSLTSPLDDPTFTAEEKKKQTQLLETFLKSSDPEKSLAPSLQETRRQMDVKGESKLFQDNASQKKQGDVKIGSLTIEAEGNSRAAAVVRQKDSMTNVDIASLDIHAKGQAKAVGYMEGEFDMS